MLKIIPTIVTHNDSLYETEDYVVRRDHSINSDGVHTFWYKFYISRKEVAVPKKKPKDGEAKEEIRIIDKKCPHFLSKNQFGVYCTDASIKRELVYYGAEHKYFQYFFHQLKDKDIESRPELAKDKFRFGVNYIIWKFYE